MYLLCVCSLIFNNVNITAYLFPMRTFLDIAFITGPQEKQNKFSSQDMYISVFNKLLKQFGVWELEHSII